MAGWLKRPGGYTKYYGKHKLWGYVMRSGAIIKDNKFVNGWTVVVGHSRKYPALTLSKAKALADKIAREL